MNPIWIRIFACCALVFGVAACDIEQADDPPDAAADATMGAGGEGGEGGAGGEGGEGGVGGEGGEGGAGGQIPDGPCAELDEAGCGLRDDCAARRDVFGEFVDCRPLGEAACAMLDESDCGNREDCTWADDLCSPVAVACAERGDEASCTDNGCHWYDDGCHDDPPPARCDQPDPVSCENAGCTWTDVGCMPTPPACEELPMPGPCDARPDCRWNNNRCEVDPGELACADLDVGPCTERRDCVWADEACRDRPMGECGALTPEQCDMRPDCEGEWVPCQCDPADENCDACEEFFVCGEREFDCGDVPLDACEPTPGCTVAVDPFCDENCNCPPDAECDCIDCVPMCVPDEGFRCEQLDERACEADPGCHVEWVDDCNDGGGFGDGDGDVPFPEPCGQQPICVPGGGGGGDACGDIADPARCEATDGCGLQEICDCDDPPPPPEGCECEPGAPCPCLVAAPCDCRVECVPMGGGMCEEIADPNRCADTPGCHVEEECFCDDAPARPAPPPCECDPNDPDCFCVEDPIAPPCECVFRCVDDGGQGCEGLDIDACWNDPSCEWIGGEVPPGECGCFIDENGEEVCFCEGGDPAMGGFCVDAPPADRCGDIFDAERCDGTFGCEWLPAPGQDPAECGECFIDENGNEVCVACPEPGGGICVEARDPCDGLDEAACNNVEECFWEGNDIAEPCVCEPGPDGEEICNCDGDPNGRPAPMDGWCVWGGRPIEPACWDLDARACADDPECRWWDAGGDVMCPPCEPGQDCPPCAEPPAMCMPLEAWCGNLDLNQCAADDACRVEEVEICEGGGALPPECPPGEPCEPPPPPPPGGECWVEQYCAFVGWRDDGEEPQPGEPVEPAPDPNAP